MSQITSQIPDATIRRFLFAQLSALEQSVFEKTLLANSQLEQCVKLAELELIDDYCGNRLKPKECNGFHRKFLITTNRQKQLEVSIALRNTLAGEVKAQPPARQLFDWPRFAWRIAFATLALLILFASVVVIRREPQIVKKVIPKRWRPAAVTTPTPQTAHHATSSSESPSHRDEPSPWPAHEASPQTIVLRPSVTADNAPVITLPQNNTANDVRLELLIERAESEIFSIVVTNSKGAIVHNVPEIRVEAADRIDFDVQIARLKPGEYHVTLTRLDDQHATTALYHFRVQ